jgi:6-pyruvoyltetrahydropterin/6-carboxytetrahydropterin synthase
MGHENKCGHLHGHNFEAEITVSGVLDSIGRVIDFSVLKSKIGAWIDENWDHGFIIHQDDSATYQVLKSFYVDGSSIQKLYALPYNPTAENLAKYLGASVCPLLLPPDIVVDEVKVRETENCWGIWTP